MSAPKYPKFGQAVRDQMRAHGIKAKDVASALDVRAQAVSAYRNGAYRPEEPRLTKLARLLKVSREKLLSDDATGAQVIPAAVPDIVADAARRIAEDTVAISVIQERARGIAQQLRDALERQEGVVRTLDPYVAHETSGIARQIELEVRAAAEKEAARLRALAATPTGQTRTEDSGTPPLRRKRG